MIKKMIHTGLFLLLLLPAACSGEEAPLPDPGTGATPSPTTAVETGQAAGGEVAKEEKPALMGGAALIDPGQAGIACLGTADGAVSCLLADGSWQRFNRENSPLGGDDVTDMAVCPDGTILMAHYFGISAYDGDGWREYADGWGNSSAEALACAAADDIWVAHFDGASHFDGRVWTTYGPENFESGSEPSRLINDIAIGQDGRVWLVTSNAIASFDGRSWTRYEEGQGLAGRYFCDSITAAPSGRIWAGHGDGLLVFHDGGWEPIESPGYAAIEDLAVDPDGTVWLGTLSHGLQRYERGSWTEFGQETLGSDRINRVVIDGGGRIWVATDWGLKVKERSVWIDFRMDTSDLPDNEIRALAVVGSGPVLPPTIVEPAGSLRGAVQLDGEPMGWSAVEICVEPVSTFYNGATPCSGQPFSLAGETDGAGVFVFREVPEGFYVVTAESPTGWAFLTNDFGIGSERVPVFSGEETDIGALIIESEE